MGDREFTSYIYLFNLIFLFNFSILFFFSFLCGLFFAQSIFGGDFKFIFEFFLKNIAWSEVRGDG
ncbi:unnamed protein product [Meloidogyne enterolobii]|uniref:Uncharacterized protein n=1 Tax=Meloidogyne enterolobii TaxID=390850 RepID=A0ACB0Y021_MELEN